MLKVDISLVQRDGEEAKRVYVEAGGPLPEILEDVGSTINGIYTSLQKRSPTMADMFKAALTIGLLDPHSPCWETQDKNSISVCMTKKEATYDD